MSYMINPTDGFHGDEDEIEAVQQEREREKNDHIEPDYDSLESGTIFGLASEIKALSDKIKNGGR